MSTTTLQTVITAIITQLTDITTDNGYNFNLGSNVVEYQTSKFEPGNDGTRTSVYDDQEFEPLQMMIDKWEYEDFPITIEIETAGSTSRLDARKMVDDVLTNIGTDETFSANVKKTVPGPIIIQTEQDDKKISRILIDILVTFETDRWRI